MILITDGIICFNSTKIDNLAIPKNCSIHSFGIGEDHDSQYLHHLSLLTHGCYYYIDNINDIPKELGTMIDNILELTCCNINVSLVAQDGARIVNLFTPFNITQNKLSKEFIIDIGSISRGEKKTIIFKISLRKMKQAMTKHDLLHIQLDYTNYKTGKRETIVSELSICRPSNIIDVGQGSFSIQKNLNRYKAAKTIKEAIDLTYSLNFEEAQILLDNLIKDIQNQYSNLGGYFERQLILDLNYCKQNMKDIESLKKGIHSSHALCSMYYMEKFGCRNVQMYNFEAVFDLLNRSSHKHDMEKM